MLVSSYITPKARKGVSSAIEGRGLVAVAPIAADLQRKYGTYFSSYLLQRLASQPDRPR
jgi:hypothetical protein